MKATKVLPLILLATACRVTEPSYFEMSPYLQRGSHEFSRPVSSFDEDSYGLMFTLGWNLNEQYEGMRNLASLDVDKAGRLTLDQPEPPVPVIVTPGSPTEVTVENDGPIPIELNPPKRTEEAISFLLWAMGISIIVFVLHKAKVPIPFFKKEQNERR